jgi:hypothetical protein
MLPSTAEPSSLDPESKATLAPGPPACPPHAQPKIPKTTVVTRSFIVCTVPRASLARTERVGHNLRTKCTVVRPHI